MKKLYLFDFDGTITHKDTLFSFLKYSNSNYYLGFIYFIPLFILSKLNLIDPADVKRHFIAYFFKGKRVEELEQLALNYCNDKKQELIRSKALDYIKNIPKEADKYIVSASLDIWLKPFADVLGMKLICTEAKFENDIFTGNFLTKNCNNEEKAHRIKQRINLDLYDEIEAFGDTKGDFSMFELAHKTNFKFFE